METATKMFTKTSRPSIWLWIFLVHAVLALSILFYYQAKIDRIEERIETIKNI
ncbi:MAG TPA: hypothetical protein PK037_03175 [Saprospiraceae bacterium]|nr:hypothetical protein [Saprospiraceae bacterium]